MEDKIKERRPSNWLPTLPRQLSVADLGRIGEGISTCIAMLQLERESGRAMSLPAIDRIDEPFIRYALRLAFAGLRARQVQEILFTAFRLRSFPWVRDPTTPYLALVAMCLADTRRRPRAFASRALAAVHLALPRPSLSRPDFAAAFERLARDCRAAAEVAAERKRESALASLVASWSRLVEEVSGRAPLLVSDLEEGGERLAFAQSVVIDDDLPDFVTITVKGSVLVTGSIGTTTIQASGDIMVAGLAERATIMGRSVNIVRKASGCTIEAALDIVVADHPDSGLVDGYLRAGRRIESPVIGREGGWISLTIGRPAMAALPVRLAELDTRKAALAAAQAALSAAVLEGSAALVDTRRAVLAARWRLQLGAMRASLGRLSRAEALAAEEARVAGVYACRAHLGRLSVNMGGSQATVCGGAFEREVDHSMDDMAFGDGPEGATHGERPVRVEVGGPIAIRLGESGALELSGDAGEGQ